MKKYAYLIIAHNNFSQLEKLIRLLDDKENDIYLHIDKKVKNFDFEKFEKIPQKSNLFFIKRIKVNWGGFSQIKCEINLFKEASKRNYEYYHLLSGVDLPIKTQEEIKKRIEKDKGKLFINYTEDCCIKENNILERICLFHFFQEWVRSKRTIIVVPAKILEKISLTIQKKLGVNRLKKKKKIEIKYGAQWISVPHCFVEYVLEQEKQIYELFRFSNCCDELVMQTLAYNSKFKKDIYDIETRDTFHSCLRSIDWKRGNPYVYRIQDFEELIHSEYLFARKFDEKIDKEIIDKIEQYLQKENV